MTVYVDTTYAPDVLRPRWWLIADTEPEAHTFAAAIGLSRASHFYRPALSILGEPLPPPRREWWRYHLDDAQRARALAADAVGCDAAGLHDVVTARIGAVHGWQAARTSSPIELMAALFGDLVMPPHRPPPPRPVPDTLETLTVQPDLPALV